MNRRTFLKAATGLAASIGLPLEPLAAALPIEWAHSAPRWTKAYDLYRDQWLFGVSVICGPKVSETATHITLVGQEQLDVTLWSNTEELSPAAKQSALDVLLHAIKTSPTRP